MSEHQLDFSQFGALGDYVQILEIFAHTFECHSGWLSRAHGVLDLRDILFVESVYIAMECKCR